LFIFQKKNQNSGRRWTTEKIKKDFEISDAKGTEIINFIEFLDDFVSINLKTHLFKKK